ncbi:MAG: HAMP domain-containing histidine kinase [Candidatus Margulisbacteria bacterium]|nr:HAMP domain-containing histidine kinase [Candidatus Margulisiibacteriota bacterium]
MTLLRSEKIASLAHTIQEFNHELRHPLQYILTEAEFLPDTVKIKKRKNNIIKALDRANDIVDTTLRLSSRERNHQEVIKLKEVVETAVKQGSVGKEVRLSKSLSRQHLNIKGDKQDLVTIVSNLMKNANEAMPKGGALTLKTFKEDQYACIQIGDTGLGIPKDKLNKIWEPFRSRHVTKGRGLGLSIVHKFVQEHKGQIQVKSIVGEGTTFTVYLPLAEKDMKGPKTKT